MSDSIDHPTRYNAGKIEVIDAIEDWNLPFDLGSAVKYIARSGHKGAAAEDLEKAIWYIRRRIQRLTWPDMTSKQAQKEERS